MIRPTGYTLLVFAALSVLVAHMGRPLIPAREGPAFVVASPQVLVIELGDGFTRPGIHQFIDEYALWSVISLTVQRGRAEALRELLATAPLRSGERLDFINEPGQMSRLQRSWMPAARRMSLGVPLTPDQLSEEDWQDLPGVGPKLARTIWLNRQIYGDFVALERLERVKGVGPKRILAWSRFF